MHRIELVLGFVIVIALAACGSNSNAPKASGNTGAPATGVAATTNAGRAPAVSSAAPTKAPVVPSVAPTKAPTVAANQPLAVAKKGFASDQYGAIGYAFLVSNPNTQDAKDVNFQVAAYDAAGTVVDTDSSSLPFIPASKQIGIAGQMYPQNKDAKVARIDVQLKPAGFAKPNPLADALSAQNAAFAGDQYSSSVTGIVVSKATTDLKQVEVFALGYDAQDNIIGGALHSLTSSPLMVRRRRRCRSSSRAHLRRLSFIQSRAISQFSARRLLFIWYSPSVNPISLLLR